MKQSSLARIVAATVLAGACGTTPAAAAGTTMHASGTHALGSQAILLAGSTLRVTGVAGDQGGAVAFYRGAQVIKRVPVAAGAPYSASLRPGSPGRIEVRLDGATPLDVLVIRPKADVNSRGTNVRFLQVYLQRLRFGGISASGYYDYATARAVIAFRKVNRLRRTTNATPAIFRAIAAGRGAYRPRYSHQGAHIEGDLTHQVIALVRAGGRLDKVFITSSGRPGLRTPVGKHRIYKQERGVNSLAEYNMSYFKGICGIHGYFVVPTYPHSHCCLRVPIPDSGEIRNFAHIGMLVDVFYRRSAT